MFPEYYPLDPREYVRDELKVRQRRRSQYSLRAFARDLEMSPSFLCEFLAGRQGLSRARVQSIGERLKLTDEQKEHFWDLVQSHFAPNETQKKSAALRAKSRARNSDSHLKLERFHLIAGWFHFPLLEILTLEGKPRTLVDISQILNVPVSDLEEAIERFCHLGLLRIEQDANGLRYRALADITTVGEGVPDKAVRMMHQETLRFHGDAVDSKGYEDRENLTVAFSIKHGDWPELRRAVQKAILDALAKYANSAEPKEQVVSMTMQMLTLLPSNEEKRS